MANEVERTYGTEVTVISQTATVADDEVVGGDTEFTHAAGENYPMGEWTLEITDTFGAAPAGTIDVYIVRGNLRGGTDDDTALGYAALSTTDNQTDPEYAEFIGSFPADVDEAYRATRDFPIPPSAFKAYIQNSTGQTLAYSTNAITLKVRPWTYAPGS